MRTRSTKKEQTLFSDRTERAQTRRLYHMVWEKARDDWRIVWEYEGIGDSGRVMGGIEVMGVMG
jgi:hypothetical protein